MQLNINSISIVMFFERAFVYQCIWVSQDHICCMSAMQWSCYSSQYIAAKETCCQPPRLFLSLHCLPLSPPLLHCPWPEGTVGFLNALPPLWAHIDWLSAPPKAEQHGVPAASFMLVLLKKKKSEGKKRGVENHQEASPQPVEVCLFSVCLPLLL